MGSTNLVRTPGGRTVVKWIPAGLDDENFTLQSINERVNRTLWAGVARSLPENTTDTETTVTMWPWFLRIIYGRNSRRIQKLATTFTSYVRFSNSGLYMKNELVWQMPALLMTTMTCPMSRRTFLAATATASMLEMSSWYATVLTWPCIRILDTVSSLALPSMSQPVWRLGPLPPGAERALVRFHCQLL